VEENFIKYGKYHRLATALLIGGMSPVEQERALLRGVDVLIATPGRLLEHFEKGKIILTDVRYLIIDEADRMLDMGFIPDIETIVSKLPAARQTLMFSATMPKAIRKLAEQFLNNPVEITITPKAMTADNVVQYLIPAPDAFAAKRALLRKLLQEQAIQKAIIFLNRKRDVDVLAKSLERHGYRVAAMHGDMTQGERLRTLDQFKADGFDYLVASDVAARGIHVEGLPVVINFDVPHVADDYVHRIGRTGRAGQTGKAYTIASNEHAKHLEAVQEYTKAQFVTLDLGMAEDLPEAAEKRGRPARGRRDRSALAHGEASARAHRREPEPDSVSVEPIADTTPAERQPRPARPSSRPDRAAAGTPAGSIKANEPRRQRERGTERSGDRDQDGTPQGMGDHVPAFLLGPLK
jgi:superfamily II DNA/RNA helicase